MANCAKADFVNVGSEGGPLNGYQRRLIHQLVKNEFPGCRTFARNDKSFMQIEKTDPKKEVEVRTMLHRFIPDCLSQRIDGKV